MSRFFPPSEHTSRHRSYIVDMENTANGSIDAYRFLEKTKHGRDFLGQHDWNQNHKSTNHHHHNNHNVYRSISISTILIYRWQHAWTWLHSSIDCSILYLLAHMLHRRDINNETSVMGIFQHLIHVWFALREGHSLVTTHFSIRIISWSFSVYIRFFRMKDDASGLYMTDRIRGPQTHTYTLRYIYASHKPAAKIAGYLGRADGLRLYMRDTWWLQSLHSTWLPETWIALWTTWSCK